MRTSQLLISTLKETPADAEISSHQLMLRAGMIRKLEAGGLYTWLPLGLKVLRRVEQIVREEMDKTGAQEVLMPVVQPAELWEDSGRWQFYGPELLRFTDRHQRQFCLGPTHEEVITDLARKELQSYKQLPINFYQIQTKFRDEIRPRFGIMRAREFIMKDAYSFHASQTCLDQTYQIMFDTYTHIFSRLGLTFRPVLADTGSIGGNTSHEFHVLADAGEDVIAYSDSSDYAANVELAEAICQQQRPVAKQDLKTVDTPNQHSIEEISQFLNCDASACLKTLLVKGTDTDVIALVLRGDHQLNTIKAIKIAGVASPLTMAKASEIKSVAGCDAGSIGPVGLDIPIIADHSALALADFVCGANQNDKHLIGVNWERDLPLAKAADLRDVITGDLSPDGQGHLKLTRGIEVGHIFQLGKKYSEAMNATILDQKGKKQTMTMGCYGIGISRIVAAAIEQNHDDKGIIWTDALAPFQVVILPMNGHKSELVKTEAEKLYQQLQTAGIRVLIDDRKERPGVMFKDMELIGIPHRVVFGERSLAQGEVEYKGRTDDNSQQQTLTDIFEFLQDKLTV